MISKSKVNFKTIYRKMFNIYKIKKIASNLLIKQLLIKIKTKIIRYRIKVYIGHILINNNKLINTDKYFYYII